jgi:hypothetical protein
MLEYQGACPLQPRSIHKLNSMPGAGTGLRHRDAASCRVLMLGE